MIDWNDSLIEFFKIGIGTWLSVFLLHRVWSFFRGLISGA